MHHTDNGVENQALPAPGRWRCWRPQ